MPPLKLSAPRSDTPTASGCIVGSAANTRSRAARTNSRCNHRGNHILTIQGPYGRNTADDTGRDLAHHPSVVPVDITIERSVYAVSLILGLVVSVGSSSDTSRIVGCRSRADVYREFAARDRRYATGVDAHVPWVLPRHRSHAILTRSSCGPNHECAVETEVQSCGATRCRSVSRTDP